MRNPVVAATGPFRTAGHASAGNMRWFDPSAHSALSGLITKVKEYRDVFPRLFLHYHQIPGWDLNSTGVVGFSGIIATKEIRRV